LKESLEEEKELGFCGEYAFFPENPTNLQNKQMSVMSSSKELTEIDVFFL